MLAEGHARIATPLYNIAFMALALSAIIGGGFSRLGYARRIAVMSAVAAGVRLAGFQAQAAAEDAVWINALQYAVPIATTWFALAAVFRQRVSRHIDINRRSSPIGTAEARA
jgi:lipopolysaccharide export system permease protein